MLQLDCWSHTAADSKSMLYTAVEHMSVVLYEFWQKSIRIILYNSMTGYSLGTAGYTKGLKALSIDISHTVCTFASQFT